MELNDIKGLGPKTINQLYKLGIKSIDDLLTYYPYRYQVLKVSNINELTEKSGVIVGVVESNPQVSYIKRNLNKLSFRFLTSNKLVNVVIFNRAFLKSNIKINQEISLIGKYNLKSNSFVASDIKLKKIEKTQIDAKYHLIKDIKNSILIKAIDECLKLDYTPIDYIPIYLNKTYEFISKKEALNIIHKPTSSKYLKQAKLKLIYEELFIFMFKINYLKYKNEINHDYLSRNVNVEKINTFVDRLPFDLTKDQKNATFEIINDFNRPKRMNRLILGDVGSGKTIISFIAMYANYLDNYQSILMAPTEILAKQHYENILKIFQGYNINIELIIGSMKKSEKSKIIKKAENNQVDILIGTHAVLNEDLVFNNLGLVITDEQHRFGVNQRSSLQNKGHMVDVIYMSATPIPRTYALTLYGDMDTSIIKTRPNGRKEIITEIKKEKEIKDVLANILEEIKKGHQVYVVAPSILENEDNNLENVNELKEKFNSAFKGLVKIGVLHGKQKASEKEQIMVDFKDKRYNILISTTVIEVGIDIPNATSIVIFNAERFGLATLHQLRGRVGRNSLEGYCYLISDYDKERLNVLKESNDGFYISQKDFELRREGDLFGQRQSGDMTFKIADLHRDYKILLQAKKDSEKFLKDNINNNFMGNRDYLKIIKEIDFID